MESQKATVDRRIAILNGLPQGHSHPERVSGLRDYPFLVLLGEPGIGKSTVLAAEAAHDGVPMFTVREVVTGKTVTKGAPLYLDALDEYRSDGSAADKAYTLANAITSAETDRWRLTCRSEDWRKAADIAPISKTTGGEGILIAQLLPLDDNEAAAILQALGENETEQFLQQAAAFGATGFTETPLGVKLLYEAAKQGGAWPANRYELFSAATKSLAYERNELRTLTKRHGVDVILEAAERVSLILLVSGARAVWRSNNEPPRTDDNRAYVNVHDLGISRDLIDDTLDTPLFKGEGESFEPAPHRTVTEFLGAAALAQAVRGVNQPAIPLDRALALVTGHDGLPPTELRGLFAWFVAHLAFGGEVEVARQLIPLDPVTVVSYGDAAVFGTSERKLLLSNLGKRDPYFRASEIGTTSVGGLAGEDLADEFAAVLNDTGDRTHRLMTVFEALTTGKPVASLRQLLRAIVLDPLRPEWQRRRAVGAYLNGTPDPPSTRRELFEALAEETASLAREAIRAELAAGFERQALRVDDVRSILTAYQQSSSDNTMGRLYSLGRRLEDEPLPRLFDNPLADWLPSRVRPDRDHSIEISRFLDHALAASIRTTDPLPADRLWCWLKNIRREAWSELKDQTSAALQVWLDKTTGSEVDLFNQALLDDRPTHSPWAVVAGFFRLIRRPITSNLGSYLLNQTTTADNSEDRHRLLEIVVELALSLLEPELYWRTYERLIQVNEQELLQGLTVTAIQSWRIEDARRRAKVHADHEKRRKENVKILAPLLSDLAVGRHPHNLELAAHWYFERGDGTRDLQKVVHHTDANTADAIATGWRYLALRGFGEIAAKDLGKSHGENRHYYVEIAALAGIDVLLDDYRHELRNSPLVVALAALKSSFVVSEQARRREIEQWAIERLDERPDKGADVLLAYWNAALDAGATDLPNIWDFDTSALPTFLLRALDTILENRPDMTDVALQSALRKAAEGFPKDRLAQLAVRALQNDKSTDTGASLWSVTHFVLSAKNDNKPGQGVLDRVIPVLTNESAANLISALCKSNEVDHLRISGLMIQTIGPLVTPQDEFSRDARVRGPQRLSETLRRAINAVASDPRPEAGKLLSTMASDPGLEAWYSNLQHAYAQQLRLQRDSRFRHPAPASVREVFRRGPPANASDLRAIVVCELRQLQVELRTSPTTPWKHYWNRDSSGKVTSPLIENECRDHLLERLRDRLSKYQIAVALPEVRRGEGTRADIVMVTGVGRNLPIEAKRHYNADIWTAASTQLPVYASDIGADGFGVYLVFWFGTQFSTPARSDGIALPASASEMELLLVSDLPLDLRKTTDIVVFDLSDKSAVRRRGRTNRSGDLAKARANSKGKTNASAKAAKKRRKGRKPTKRVQKLRR